MLGTLCFSASQLKGGKLDQGACWALHCPELSHLRYPLPPYSMVSVLSGACTASGESHSQVLGYRCAWSLCEETCGSWDNLSISCAEQPQSLSLLPFLSHCRVTAFPLGPRGPWACESCEACSPWAPQGGLCPSSSIAASHRSCCACFPAMDLLTLCFCSFPSCFG